ncbi:MAG: AAA family ATPase [Gammaproteobacteria bacterium]|nr:AAA family ATPase [Gammaproteobacteria bacterium]
MYNNYFGFKESPFSIAPNPHFLYMSPRHREALAHLLYGIEGVGGFILLTGEVGTGKTTVCRCLLEQMPDNVDTAFILNPKLTVQELLAAICDDLQISYPDNASIKTLIDGLNHFLLDSLAKNRQTLLIIDEAQNLSAEVLEQLRLLTNLETNQKKLLQIILIGQPELLDLLARKELRQLNQRITARFHLEALSRQEVSSYIAHRLAVARGKGDIFTDTAIKKIYRLSQGIPRLINLLCDRSLLGTYAGNQARVSGAVVNKAAREIFGHQRNTKKLFWWTGLGGLVFVALALALTLPQLHTGFWWNPQSLSGDDFTVENSPSSMAALNFAHFSPASRGYETENLALIDLLGVWGTPEELIDNDRPCDTAPASGLGCLKESGGIEAILAFDRPAVIRLQDAYFTLLSLSGQRLQLRGPDTVYELDLSDATIANLQSFTLVWRLPPGYRSPLNPGDRGMAVDWLSSQMAVINEQPLNQPEGKPYNEHLHEQVKAFQTARGLNPNGTVDARTWIHINSVQGLGIPFLKEKRA